MTSSKTHLVWGLVSLAILSTIFILSPQGGEVQAAGNVYYISPTGNDSNPGNSTSAPFRTIQKGVNLAVPGDTVILMDGTWGHGSAVSDNTGNGDTAIATISKAGTPTAYITLKAQHKWGAVLDCEYTGPSTGCDNPITIHSGAAYWIFQDLVLKRGLMAGIRVAQGSASHDIVMKGNKFEYIGNVSFVSTYGIVGTQADDTTYNYTIDGNIFHDIGRTNDMGNSYDHGIYIHTTNAKIINNIFYRALAGWHIQLASNFSGLIANNTFYGPNMYGNKVGQIMLWNPEGSVTIRNNIFYNSRSTVLDNYNYSLYSGATCVIDNNIVYGSGVTVGNPAICSNTNNRLNTDPLFVDPINYDFHLQINSPAKDTGVTVTQVAKDFDDNLRPQGSLYDVGAYEYVVVNNNPGPIITNVTASNIAQSGAIISWLTDQQSTSQVEYGVSASALTPTILNNNLTQTHSVVLSGLARKTTYYYRVSSSNSNGVKATSSVFSFKTSAGKAAIGPNNIFLAATYELGDAVKAVFLGLRSLLRTFSPSS